MSTPAQASQSRIFLIEGRAGPTHAPSYHSQLRATGISAGFGDIEPIQEPDPARYGDFIDVGQVVGAEERPTFTLEGRFALDLKSDLLRLAQQKCDLDVQIHLGACQDPRDFNSFSKAIILERARESTYNTDDLGVLQSGDNAAVNETADISAGKFYEVVPISYSVKAGTIITNEALDVVVCDTRSCGECEAQSDGCQKIFVITKSAGGSPSTPADVLYSIDKGVNWYAHDIESLGVAEDPSAIDCIAQYIVVVSETSVSLHYALKSEFDGHSDPTWTEVTTGFVAAHGPNGIYVVDGIAFIVGDGGYIYKSLDPTAGVTVMEPGSLTTATLRKVHGISSAFLVAVGDNGAILYTADGISWNLSPTSPVGFAVNLTAVWIKSEREWFVGTSTGLLYYTADAGITWTQKSFYGSGAGAVRDIFFSTDSVGWLSHSTATPLGRILRSFDGGYSWKITPEVSGLISANDRVNAIGGCENDPNFVVGVGLADDAADGFIVVGTG